VTCVLVLDILKKHVGPSYLGVGVTYLLHIGPSQLGLVWIEGFSKDFHRNTVHKGNFYTPSFG
jgi:hypothetical protein